MPNSADLAAIKRMWSEFGGNGVIDIHDAEGNVIGQVAFAKRGSTKIGSHIKKGGVTDSLQEISRLGEGSRCPVCGR